MYVEEPCSVLRDFDLVIPACPKQDGVIFGCQEHRLVRVACPDLPYRHNGQVVVDVLVPIYSRSRIGFKEFNSRAHGLDRAMAPELHISFARLARAPVFSGVRFSGAAAVQAAT